MRLLSWMAGAVTLGILLGGAGLLLAQNKPDPQKPDPAGAGKVDDKVDRELTELGDTIHQRLRELREQLTSRKPVVVSGARAGERLGALLGRPGSVLTDQLNLKAGQGLVVTTVIPESAAAKAGLKANDILLQIAGKDVPSDGAAFAKMIEDVKPDAPVDVVVLRKGKQETIKGVTLPAAKTKPK